MGLFILLMLTECPNGEVFQVKSYCLIYMPDPILSRTNSKRNTESNSHPIVGKEVRQLESGEMTH